MSNPNFTFELLDRIACKASIMIEGLTGSGKSGAAIMIAYGLAGGFKKEATEKEKDLAWKKIFAADTENKSLNLFVGLPGSWGTPFKKFYGFQLDEILGYRPSNYLALRQAAVKAKGEVFISDSITHMWNAKGGVLYMVSDYKRNNPKDTDNYRVWGQENISQEKQMIIETMRHKDIHCISTVRVKEKYDMQWDEGSKKNKVVSLGEQQIQQADLKYEPDLVLHMLEAGSPDGTKPKVAVLKSRYAVFKKDEEYDLTPELIEQMRQYLAEGVDPEVLLEQQRQDYILAVTEFLNKRKSAVAIWQVLKEDAGYKDEKLTDLPLEVIKKLYIKIVTD